MHKNKSKLKDLTLAGLTKNCPRVKPAIFWSTIFLFIIIIILFYVFIVPGAKERNEGINEILSPNTAQVISIEINQDIDKIPSGISRFKDSITDKKIIKKFCKVLSTMHKITPNHPVTVAEYIITIKYPDRKTKFIISNIKDKGYCIFIYSNKNGQDGWFYGAYTSPEFNKYMESVLKQHTKSGVTNNN